MKKLLVYMDDDFHEDLKELAHRRKTTMAALVRYALDATFEDELDVIAGEKGLEETIAGRVSTVTLDEYLQKRGLAVPGRTKASRREGARSAAR
jgi:predicted transcriptional regulator